MPPELEDAARGRRTRAPALREVEGVGSRKYRLREDIDNIWRSRCE